MTLVFGGMKRSVENRGYDSVKYKSKKHIDVVVESKAGNLKYIAGNPSSLNRLSLCEKLIVKEEMWQSYNFDWME